MMVGLAAALCSAAQEGGEKRGGEGKELKFMGAPYFYSGPDTGAGFGFSLLYRDMFGKPGRDVTFDFSSTQRGYQIYGVDWQEPELFSPRGRFRIYVGYETIPARRFYGIGNDNGENDDCNWSSTQWLFEPAYLYRWPETVIGTLGFRGSFIYRYMDPDNGRLRDSDDTSYNRRIRRVYPALYHSRDFAPSTLAGLGFVFYRDTRKDRFPLGGGQEEIVWPMGGAYEELSYERYEESLGSDFSFQKFSLDLRRFFQVFNPDTIFAVRLKLRITQGDVPFYEMPFLSGDDLRGYYEFRFLDKNSTQVNLELRQGFFSDRELPLFNGAIVLKYPSLFVYWEQGRVYEDYTRIGDDLFKDYHWAYGWGLRFVVTPSIVVRFEWGNSEELGPAQLFYMTAGLPF